MRHSIRRRVRPLVLAAAVAVCAGAGALPSLASLAVGGDDRLDFLIRRAGDDIGRHSIRIDHDGRETRVEVDIEITVKLLFITAYRYRHRNTELWRDGRLVSIDTRTDNDGDTLFVRGRATADGFAVTHSAGAYLAPADVVPTSYWHPETTRQTRMLNTQNGRLITMEISERGAADVVDIGGNRVRATRYDIDGELDVDLFYDAAGRLASIAFYPPDSDTLIAYERRQ